LPGLLNEVHRFIEERRLEIDLGIQPQAEDAWFFSRKIQEDLGRSYYSPSLGGATPRQFLCTAAEQPISQAVPQPPRSFRPLALTFACAVVLVVAWRITHVSAIGSAAWVACVVMFAIWLPNRRHFQAYRREVRALPQREKSGSDD
jgi:hypothetical protein